MGRNRDVPAIPTNGPSCCPSHPRSPCQAEKLSKYTELRIKLGVGFCRRLSFKRSIAFAAATSRTSTAGVLPLMSSSCFLPVIAEKTFSVLFGARCLGFRW